MLVVPPWQRRDSHFNCEDVAMTSLIWPAARNHTQTEYCIRRLCTIHAPVCFFFFFVTSSPAPLCSAGRHQRRRIMYNYNRQSKTKPFTFNEILLEKGRLPQGGILMKQMAECSQGQRQTVLLLTVCQHLQHSEGLHLSLDRSLCASVCDCVCVYMQDVCLLKHLTRWRPKKIKKNGE